MAASERPQRAPAFANDQRRRARVRPAALGLWAGAAVAPAGPATAGRASECFLASSGSLVPPLGAIRFDRDQSWLGSLRAEIFGRVRECLPLGVGLGEGLQRFDRPSPLMHRCCRVQRCPWPCSSAELRRAAGNWRRLARWQQVASSTNARWFRQPGMHLRISSAAL